MFSRGSTGRAAVPSPVLPVVDDDDLIGEDCVLLEPVVDVLARPTWLPVLLVLLLVVTSVFELDWVTGPSVMSGFEPA